jgi:hypothetical protein
MGLKTRSGEPCAILLKLGRKEHLETLRNGLLYMNTLAYFNKLEADSARSDEYEGTDSILQPQHVRHFIIEPNVPGVSPHRVNPQDLDGPLRWSRNRTSACNVFCMFSITEPIVGPVFPEGYEWFGDHFVIFTDTPEFLTRVGLALQSQGLRGCRGMVEYYDESEYSGETGRFRKRSRFAYQREFRIIVEPGLDGPRCFEIGDLTDITSEVTPLSLADDVLKFTPEEATAAGLTWDIGGRLLPLAIDGASPDQWHYGLERLGCFVFVTCKADAVIHAKRCDGVSDGIHVRHSRSPEPVYHSA